MRISDLSSDVCSSDLDSVRALGERKARFFRESLQAGIEPSPGAEELLQNLRRASIKTAVASSSKNCAVILRASGLEQLVEVRADGLDCERLGLQGRTEGRGRGKKGVRRGRTRG